MNPLLRRARLALAHLSDSLANRLRNNFYLYLAALFSLFVIADALVFNYTAGMRQAAFDQMVRYRLVVPPPDPDIVIVDIDEASLAAMAKDYGRWPWPRQVLGEFLEQLEQQQPKAVVFDILFSDPDVYNPDSDAYFNAAIAATGNTFFPMLRLDPASDALSEIRPAMIPGVTPLSDQAAPDATVAVVLPHFEAALAGGRLGLHNIAPDPDGVVREYRLYRDDHGWKIPSLPLRIGQALGWPEPGAQRVLLNWRGQPFAYHYVSFSDVFADMTRQHKTRPPDEFTGKIVLIGSTAPSLFDVKPTPLSQLHPGVEILATAIDNLRHDDFLRVPEARLAYLILTLLVLWATAWGFYRNVGRDKFDRLFGASQFILLGISYASINFTTTYINLTGPVTVCLAYYTVARLYAFATSRALETSSVRRAQQHGEWHAVLLLIRLPGEFRALGERAREKLRRDLERAGAEPKSADILTGSQRGVWGLFDDTLVVSWLIPAANGAARARVTRDIDAVTEALRAKLPRYGYDADHDTERFVHEGPVSGGASASAQWRALAATALLRRETAQREGQPT